MRKIANRERARTEASRGLDSATNLHDTFDVDISVGGNEVERKKITAQVEVLSTAQQLAADLIAMRRQLNKAQADAITAQVSERAAKDALREERSACAVVVCVPFALCPP